MRIISIFDRDYLVSIDGTRRYPARGEMNHNHIMNTIRFIENSTERWYGAYRLQSEEPVMSIQSFREYIRNSTLMGALTAGLTLHDIGEYRDIMQFGDTQYNVSLVNYEKHPWGVRK